MTQPPSIRASDEDRQRVVDQLGEHHVAGRLDQAEFDDRMRAAYTAKTLGDLALLMHDLPHVPPEAKPAQAADARRARTNAMRGAFASWASTAVLVLVIWLATSVATGHMTYFWPFWVVGPWGAILLFRAVDGLVKGPGEGGGRGG
jgi:hypothetical protein